MSKSDYDEFKKRREIRDCSKDPRAEDLGYDQYSVQATVKGSTLVFKHLDDQSNPDAWIAAPGGFWYNIEAFGAAEHTKRE